MQRDIVWQSLTSPGLEHLDVRSDGEGVRFDSVVVDAGELPFRAWYEIYTDATWRVRSCLIRLLGPTTREIELIADGRGHWTDSSGASIPSLNGCIDVDLTATPSTNALLIRRLALGPGESADIRVAWIQFPELDVTPSPQRYTCLERSADGGRYRFLALDGGFTTELPVDADGFVLDYADRWKRLR